MIALVKLALAALAAACAPTKRWLLIAVAAAGILTCVVEYRVHLPDQFHYVMGARWFPEIGYSNLYRCAVVAEDELGGELTAEAREPDRRIRDVDGTNLLVRVRDLGLLEHREACTGRFTPARWAAFKADIRFFREQAGARAFGDMLKDHGFNAPPVWLLAGRALATLAPASTTTLALLALADVAFLIAMFAALAWAFGWRVCAIAAIVWSCQGPASFLWTGGAFLRQDWLFFLVLAMCAARRRRFGVAGASLACASLLRVFPIFIAVGWAVVVVASVVRRRRLARAHRRALLGAVLATALLVPASVAVGGPRAWPEFAHRTLGVHNRTWTSNLMGASVVVAYVGSPRLEDSIDAARVDASAPWREARAESYRRWRLLAWVVGAAGLGLFILRARRVRSLWVAGCLAQVLIVLLAQIACYYYAFLVLLAPLVRVRRDLEAKLLGFVAATQVASLLLPWPDDQYALLSLMTAAFGLYIVASRPGSSPAP